MPTQIYWTLEEVPYQARSINTVGTFDGLHRGHQAILREVRREAAAYGAIATVVTFSPHPQLVLRNPQRPPVKILTTDAEKLELLRAERIDRVVVMPFSLEFSRTSSEVFVRELLCRRIGMSGAVLGHDHGFGRDREGDFATIQRLGTELNFTVRELPPCEVDGIILSSTRIRQLLMKGDVVTAARFLGRPYELSAHVVRGDGRGQSLGFPTANLSPESADKLVPTHGVYAVRVHHRHHKWLGMMNIGLRPTFREQRETLEVHLFDFAGELYGETLSVEFVKRLRAEKRFESAAALAAQLASDRAVARKLLASAG